MAGNKKTASDLSDRDFVFVRTSRTERSAAGFDARSPPPAAILIHKLAGVYEEIRGEEGRRREGREGEETIGADWQR
eukprot:664512-Hanusia_phi.AAC.1